MSLKKSKAYKDKRNRIIKEEGCFFKFWAYIEIYETYYSVNIPRFNISMLKK